VSNTPTSWFLCLEFADEILNLLFKTGGLYKMSLLVLFIFIHETGSMLTNYKQL